MRRSTFEGLNGMLCLILTAVAVAQPPVPKADLARQQEELVRRYAEFELLIRRMADNLKPADPPRAALLEKTLQESRKALIGVGAEELAKALAANDYARAVQSHAALVERMQSLLDLLLSEDAAQRLRLRREALQKTAAAVRRLRDSQEGLLRRTERQTGPAELGRLAPEQQNLAQQAHEASEAIPADGPDPHNLQNAGRAMQQAARQLQSGQQAQAQKEQQNALANLDRTLAELEEKLRQLREEERQQRLASLEEEFRQMLHIQRQVYDGMQAVDRIPVAQRTPVEDQKALTLAKSEHALLLAADRVALVLHDDGTAHALPEAVELVRGDAATIERLLQKAEVGPLPQGLARDVIGTLEELLAAVQRAQRGAAARSQSPARGGGNRPPPLVEAIAELKMIRALQTRINDRTARLAQFDKSKLSAAEQRAAFDDLAQRQQRVYEIARAVAREAQK